MRTCAWSGAVRYTGGMAPPSNSGEQGVLQLSFSALAEPPVPGAEGHILTRALRDHPSRAKILRMVRIALSYFPELEGTWLRIGLARGVHGYASLEEPAIWLNPRGLNYQTIAHELVHLLQARGLVPMGERSCDIFALARDRILVDAPPVYLEIPDALATPGGGLREGASYLLHKTAREALRRRGEGERRYIRWFEKRVAEATVQQAFAARR